MTLDQIPDGLRLVLDTSVLIRAASQRSAECARLLARCESGELQGLVPLPAVAELTHRLMVRDARFHGKATGSNPARWLSERPQEVVNLPGYRKTLSGLLSSNLHFEPAAKGDYSRSLELQHKHGFLTNDSLIAAMALRLAADAIASTDAAFRRLPGMNVYSPGDAS